MRYIYVMSLATSIVKSSLLFFVVGVAVAATVPFVAPYLGLTTTTASLSAALMNGLTFGVFGGFNALLAPLADGIFGADTPVPSPQPAHTLKLHPTVSRGHEMEIKTEPSTRFADQIQESRAQASLQNTLTVGH